MTPGSSIGMDRCIVLAAHERATDHGIASDLAPQVVGVERMLEETLDASRAKPLPA